MTDGQAFLLVFAIIYLSDCLVWLTPAAHAVISRRSWHFDAKRSAVFFPGLKKGFAFLRALPPLGTVFVTEGWIVTPGPGGLSPVSRENPNPGRLVPPAPEARFMAWPEVESVRVEECRILVNGKVFCRCATFAGARLLGSFLERLSRMTPGERSAAISAHVRRAFDERRARRKADWFRRAVRPLRWTCCLLFFGIFLLVPYSYWRFEDEPPFFLTLGAVWLLMWQAAIEFWFLHRRLYPALAQERWQHVILSLLFPQHAIRSIDTLSRGFLTECHPLAIVAALGIRSDFESFAGRVRRDALHPIPLSEKESPAVVESEDFRTRHWLPAIESLLKRKDFTKEERATADGGGSAECPRCAGEYQQAGIPCIDCGGILTVDRGR